MAAKCDQKNIKTTKKPKTYKTSVAKAQKPVKENKNA